MMKKVLFISIFLSSFGYAQVIQTISGTAGTQGTSGLGGPANSALHNTPFDIEFDNQGNYYVSDQGRSVVLKVDALTGVISNIFGTGVFGEGSASELGPDFKLATPSYIDIDPSGNFLFVCDHGNQKIFRMNLNDSTVVTFCGTGTAGSDGDGNQATATNINTPLGVVVAGDGEVYFCENGNFKVRKVKVDGTVETVAGTGLSTSSDGPVGSASFDNLFGIEIDEFGNLYVSEPIVGKIRKIDVGSGFVTTYCGTGSPGWNGDSLAAAVTQINYVQDMGFDLNGDLIIADNENNRVRKIDKLTTIVTTIAGNGTAGFYGDGGNPKLAALDGPLGVAINSNGDIYWNEIDNFIVRKMTTCMLPSIPVIGFTLAPVQADSTFCPGVFSFTVLNGDLNDATNWAWYLDSCAGTPIAIGGSFNYDATTNFTIAARGEGGCTLNGPCQKLSLDISPCDQIDTERINAFSPNNDGVNDYLFIVAAELNPVNTVSIYNRWGDVIFKIADYDNLTNVWEGKDEFNNQVGVGTYFYIFEADNTQYSAWVNVVK
jgi:gliding motility-associated-like protein